MIDINVDLHDLTVEPRKLNDTLTLQVGNQAWVDLKVGSTTITLFMPSYEHAEAVAEAILAAKGDE